MQQVLVILPIIYFFLFSWTQLCNAVMNHGWIGCYSNNCFLIKIWMTTFPSFVTFFMRSKQRKRLISLLRPWGKSLINSISSSPPKAAHLWRSKWRTLRLKCDGSCLLLIHHSMSRHLSCSFLFFAITASRNTFITANIYDVSMPQFLKMAQVLACTLQPLYIPGCSQSTKWKAVIH